MHLGGGSQNRVEHEGGRQVDWDNLKFYIPVELLKIDRSKIFANRLMVNHDFLGFTK